MNTTRTTTMLRTGACFAAGAALALAPGVASAMSPAPDAGGHGVEEGLAVEAPVEDAADGGGTDVQEPAGEDPQAVEPEPVEPEVVEPEVAEPEPASVEPASVEPETVEPEAVEPEVAQPEPAPVKADAVEPEVVEPEAVEPEAAPVESTQVVGEERGAVRTEVTEKGAVAQPANVVAAPVAGTVGPELTDGGRVEGNDKCAAQAA